MGTIANVNKLNDTIDEFEKITTEMNTINETLKGIDSLYQQIAATSESYMKIEGNFENVSTSIEKSLENIKNNVVTLKEENTKLYRDTQDYINRGLEKNRSDIQMDIRGEGALIERNFHNLLDKNFLELHNNVKEKFGEIDSKISSIFQTMEKHEKYFKILIALNAFVIIGIVLGFVLK